MKQPVSKLPFKIKGFGIGNQIISNDEQIAQINGMWLDDMEYIVEACNNYPIAIEFLERIVKTYEGSSSMLIFDIKQFLNELENEHN